MVDVTVQRPVLEWARRRSGRDEVAMRRRFHAWDRWIDGTEHPTFSQAQDLAEFTHVPFGLLLAPDPPLETLPIPDFRSGRGETLTASDDLLESIYLCQRRQGWYEDYLATVGYETLPFVGSMRGASVQDAAAAISDALDYRAEGRRRFTTIDAARKHLITRFEHLGGLVVLTSMVGNNPQRMLDLEEFRGFTLHSDIAPLVFVNSHDAKRGQVFSLLHEFAHVWRGESGVSEGGEPLATEGEAEKWCDHVAAEIAVPESDLRERFRSEPDLTAELDLLADYYRCSTLVVLLRLRATGLIPSSGFRATYDRELERLLALIAGGPKGEGGTFYNNQPFRIGETLSRALIRDTLRGRTAMTEALSLMSFKSAPVFDSYARHLGEG